MSCYHSADNCPDLYIPDAIASRTIEVTIDKQEYIFY